MAEHRRPGRQPLDEARKEQLDAQRSRLLTVKEYAYVTREHPMSVYRRIREGRQPGVHRVGGNIRLESPSPPV